MSHVVGRLGAFALVLAGTFGTAYAVGERLPGHTHSAQDGHTHTGTGMSTPVPPGFESGGYQLVTDHAHAGMATFHLRDEAGSDVTEFTEAHGSLLHVVVILSLIHIPEPTRPLSISYAVFCLKKKKTQQS